MIKPVLQAGLLIVLLALGISPGFSQTSAGLKTLLSQKIGLSQDQIAAIQGGQPFAKNLESRTPAEIIVFGVVYINAAPESYVKFASDYARLEQTGGFLAIKKLSTPPQMSDFQGFALDSDDIKGLKNCKPGQCVVQAPGGKIEEMRKSIDWSAPNVDDQVNQYLQKAALAGVVRYQKEGNHIPDMVYNDKNQQVDRIDQFKYLISYAQTLQRDLPDFYNYIINYPEGKPPNVQDSFYWDSVKFGLKPTLRLVQVFTMRGDKPGEAAYVIAEKQLYSSHYFETALDLTFCIRGGDDSKGPGFYLVKVMGSEQAGLTGMKGSIVRKVAVGRSVDGLRKSLASIKTALETQ